MLPDWKKQKIKEITDVWVFLRKNDQNFPDDVLDLMKNSAIELLQGEIIHRCWIDVEERLPEQGQTVYISINRKEVAICIFLDGKFTALSKRKSFITNSVITHWMPIPDPVK